MKLENIAYPVLGLFLVVFIYDYFVNYAEYECIESVNTGNDYLATGTKVYFFGDGGVYIEEDGVIEENYTEPYTTKIKHKKVEGTEFISYLRSDGIYSSKLDKKDLTYFYRPGNRGGQCIKVGFLDKFNIGSFESVKADNEYDY